MLLQAVKTYLQSQANVSLQQLAWKFETDPNALRPLLARWLASGKLERLENPSCGSGCSRGCGSCSSTRDEIYRWVA